MNIKIQQATFQLESRPSNSQSSSLNCAENCSSSLFETCDEDCDKLMKTWYKL